MNKKQLYLFVLCSTFISDVRANTLIVTRGPVSIGMGGYLSNAIQSFNSDYHNVIQSDIMRMTYNFVLSELFPDQMTIIRNAIDLDNIPSALMCYYTYFKSTVHEEQKQQVLNALAEIRNFLNDPANENTRVAMYTLFKYSVVTQLAYYAACGYDVVWEAGTLYNLDDNDASAIKNCFDTVVETFTYSTPTTMIEKGKQRNIRAMNEKKAYDRRPIKKVLTTFFNSFKPTDVIGSGLVILTKDEFDAIIEQAADYIRTVPQEEYGENGTFTESEFTLEELFAFKEAMYDEFKFYSVDRVELALAWPYDVLLTTQEECLQFAREVTNR